LNLLITGINGFIGTNLVGSFAGSFRISGIDIGIERQEGVTSMYTWDQQENWPAVDVIIHLAGKAHDTGNTARADEYFEVNLGLTRKIFDHFLSSGATTFIFFSSVKAVTDTVAEAALTEDAIAAPATPYGQSKDADERYILDRPLPADKKVYILRPCMIHGPGNKGNLNLLFTLVSKGIPYPLGAFENRRSFTSIGNLAWILRQILEQDIAPGIYHIADDEPLPTNTLIHMMAECLGRKERIWNIPKPWIRGLARTGDVLHLTLNSERLKKLTESYVVSNDKIKAALGVEKLPITAIDGMRLTLENLKTD